MDKAPRYASSEMLEAGSAYVETIEVEFFGTGPDLARLARELFRVMARAGMENPADVHVSDDAVARGAECLELMSAVLSSEVKTDTYAEGAYFDVRTPVEVVLDDMYERMSK